MVMVVVVIMPTVVTMVAVARHGPADDRTSASPDDRAYRAADGRSRRTSDDSSPHSVFASRRAGRGCKRDTQSCDENRNTHRTPPLMLSILCGCKLEQIDGPSARRGTGISLCAI